MTKKTGKANEEKAEKEEKNSEFTAPPASLLYALSAPLRNYFTPQFFGLENVDKDKPALYVANHSIYGVTDGPLFFPELYKKKGIFLRTLADNKHFNVSVWKNLMRDFGAVPGSRENCANLMKAGEHILVFPGGGRETFKRKGERNQLIWKQRTGFAHMAIEYGYDIIPLTSVGGDDTYDILADSKEILDSFIGKFITKSGLYDKLKQGEYLPPISKGLLGTAIPKPAKIYVAFGERIPTKKFKGDTSDDNVWQVRRETEYSMLKSIMELLEFKKHDKIPALRKFLISI